jgi:hypothetical protein
MIELSPSNALRRVRKALEPMTQLPGWMSLTVEGWRERSRLRREFDDLRRRGDLDRTLSDSGIAPSDVPRLMRAHPRAPEQLAEMMQRLGIERAALAHTPAVAEALRAMQWQCGECADWRKCRKWLASRDGLGSYRAFCPNAEALDALRCSESAASGSSLGMPCGILAELETAKGIGGA